MLFLCVVVTAAVVNLTEENVDVILRNDKRLPVFVLVWDPWCPHCKVFKPEWERLAEVQGWTDRVLFASLNCESERTICKKLSPGNAFPRLLWIDTATDSIRRYSGEINITEILSFVRNQFAGPVEPLHTISELRNFSSESKNYPSFLFNITGTDAKSIGIVENVTTQLRHLDVKFGLVPDTLEHVPRLLVLENEKALEEFSGSFDPDNLKKFIKRHMWQFFAPYTATVKKLGEFEGVPVCIFILNISSPESKLQAAMEALNISSDVPTSHTFCEYNPNFCRYVGAKPGSVVIFNHSINTFWVYDNTKSDLKTWTRAVMAGKVRGKGPGVGPFKEFWIFFYETKAQGGIKYYALYFPIVISIGIVVSAIAIRFMPAKARKTD